jgi:hypothetical protein
LVSGQADRSSMGGKSGGVWGHLLVSASACLLTVSILGSGVFLVYKGYSRYQLKSKVRAIIDSLENRTQEELDQSAAQLKERPKLAEYVMPELRRTLVSSTSERQLCAAIEISRAFVQNHRIERALFELRRDGREGVAAGAVHALAGLQPPEHAAEVLGKCLDGAEAGLVVEAVVDEACAGLFALGDSGLRQVRPRLPNMPAERRAWLVGYVDSVGGPHRKSWLEMLRSDPDATVRTKAEAVLQGTAPHDPKAVARGGA